MREIIVAVLMTTTAFGRVQAASNGGRSPRLTVEEAGARQHVCYRTDLASDCVDFHLAMRPDEWLALPGASQELAPADAEPSRGAGAADQPRPEMSEAGDDGPAARVAAVEPSRFGERGSTRLYLHGGYGVHVSKTSNDEWIAGVGVEHFIEESLSLSVELNGLAIRQSGPSAYAANFNLLFRWHVIMEESWSAYLDGGAGLLFATEEVPDGASEFNFTPQAGVGATYDIGGDVRLMGGVRWHHISNANTDSNNPGRDHVLGYVGISIPF
jgi:hypothetical protein